MKNLHLALVALVVGGLFVASDADAFFGAFGGRCRKDRCTKEVKSNCAPVCEETCEPFEEESCRQECVTFKYSRPLKRKCENVTRCCTTKKCNKGSWCPEPCELKLICNGQEVDGKTVGE